ncbi:DNA mismatch endonuclease Vsr [Roseibium sp. CAU 1637]|uniref:DNA mismatch endonuclease Vsr n=1 Tax=Roseibium limicola TaxID=2816037 RepID=A0A939J6B3_9HYPH|nr:DNA mismatch endonuclease Vsr [Roseibium limicola]
MADIVDQKTRSRMMSGIRGKDTKPEIRIRKALFARGFRYRLHHKGLPGKPDLVFPRLKAVIFVNGCFWHMHDCALFKWPSTRVEFWRAKLEGNRRRDEVVHQQISELGWRQLTVWECSMKGRGRLEFDIVINEIERWLLSNEALGEIRGHGDI